MDVIKTMWHCQVCHEDFTQRYQNPNEIGAMTCPHCKMARVSFSENRRVLSSLIAFEKKIEVRFEEVIREGGEDEVSPLLQEYARLPRLRNFSVAVELEN